MLEFSKLKKGEFVSQMSFAVVTKTMDNEASLREKQEGHKIDVGIAAMENLWWSASQFSVTKSVTRTQLLDALQHNDNVACSVRFKKIDVEKNASQKKKEIAKLLKDKKEALKTDPNDVDTILTSLIENPYQSIVPGEMREIVGYHTGRINEFGRLVFFDAEDKFKPKQITLPTVEWVIVKNVKYIIK